MPGSFPDLRYFANLTLYHVSHKINEKKNANSDFRSFKS